MLMSLFCSVSLGDRRKHVSKSSPYMDLNVSPFNQENSSYSLILITHDPYMEGLHHRSIKCSNLIGQRLRDQINI